MAELTMDFKEYLYERLQEPEAVVGYLNAAAEGDDPTTFLLALRYVAEARGIANVALEADLNRESLYKMLSDQGNPRLSSLISLLGAIGVQLAVRPLAPERAAQKQRIRPLLAVVEAGYVPELEYEDDARNTPISQSAAA